MRRPIQLPRFILVSIEIGPLRLFATTRIEGELFCQPFPETSPPERKQLQRISPAKLLDGAPTPDWIDFGLEAIGECWVASINNPPRKHRLPNDWRPRSRQRTAPITSRIDNSILIQIVRGE
jgi:hypothetical protein